MPFIAYKIAFPSGKAYIGITIRTVAGRWRLHQHKARYGGRNRLSRAIRRYGAETAIIEEIAHALTVDDLPELEKLLIEQERSYITGYNSTIGGDGCGRITDEETRRKIGDSQRGRPRSPEARAKISAALKGRAKPPGFGDRLSAARKGKPWTAAARAIHVESRRDIAYRQRTSEKSKERWRDPEMRERMRESMSNIGEATRKRRSETAKRQWARQRALGVLNGRLQRC